jgi:hypothetical protein
MSDLLKRVTAERLSGERPGAPRAIGAAAVVGTVSAVIAYRLLRR